MNLSALFGIFPSFADSGKLMLGKVKHGTAETRNVCALLFYQFAVSIFIVKLLIIMPTIGILRNGLLFRFQMRSVY